MALRLLTLAALLWLPPAGAEQVARVAVAANFHATLLHLEPLFERRGDVRLEISAGSSGKLFAQILHGAPFDLFLGADRHYTERLEQAGEVVPGSRFVYARGVLVAWPLEAGEEGPRALAAASTIAIANPRTAPYGRAARQTLERLGLWPPPGRLLRGESVGQAFQFVAGGNAGIGLVALAQVVEFGAPGHYWEVPDELHAPLEQEAALLRRGRDNRAARAFLDFLRHPETRALIRARGYR